MKIIDSHAHIGQDTFPGNPLKFNITNLIKQMDRNGVEKAVIFPFPAPQFLLGKDTFWYNKENEALSKIRRAYLGRIYFAAGINLFDSASVERAEELARQGEICAVKFHSRAMGADLKNIPESSMQFLAKKNLPIIFHVGSGYEQELSDKGVDISLEEAIKVAKRFPKVRFTFAHLGRVHKNIFEALELENVAFDSAALSWYDRDKSEIVAREPMTGLPKRLSQLITFLVNKGYEDKILFGSDAPYYVSYEAELNPFLRSNVTQKQLEKMLSLNAQRWFNLN